MNIAQRTLEQMRQSQAKAQERAEAKHQPNEAEIAYAQRLRQPHDPQHVIFASKFGTGGVNAPVPLSSYYPIDFKAAKSLFWHFYKKRLGVQSPSLSGNQAQVLQAVLGHAMGYHAEHRRKSLYLWGNVGMGKTQIMYALAATLRHLDDSLRLLRETVPGHSFQVLSSDQLVREVMEAKDTKPLRRYADRHICIDDIGLETTQKLYGNELNVIGTLMLDRYQLHESGTRRTHATSNLSPKDWELRYGTRVADRMREIFIPIELVTDGYRK